MNGKWSRGILSTYGKFLQELIFFLKITCEIAFSPKFPVNNVDSFCTFSRPGYTTVVSVLDAFSLRLTLKAAVTHTRINTYNLVSTTKYIHCIDHALKHAIIAPNESDVF